MKSTLSFPIFSLLSTCLLLFFASCKQDPGAARNRLGEETSPYLLQHAQNPVHWQPWEETIWDQAREENKLVLISIGYSSCHWCHVMEEETFENDSVARFMNERFINVKVDREERPDVDQVYMTAVQLMTGSGGWPLNVVALPNGKPVYGGTYHTREQWLQVLAEVHKRFREDPARLSDYADRVAQGVAEVNLLPEAGNDAEVREGVLDAAVSGWQTRWDPKWGGNAETQKFMLPPTLNFLLDYQQLSGHDAARDHLENTLDRMARGGVFDQVGGGFFRYSTDPRWHIPHFEKMLYDNAQLLGIYARAHKQWPKPAYRQVVERIFGFLLRDMKAPGGGYFAALDADTEGEEGKYYVWEAGELQQRLGPDYEAFAAYYGINPEQAWEGDRYIPFREVPDETFARDHGIELADLQDQKRSWHQNLMQARAQRTFPRVDDKIITSWNALLIGGLAEAYDAFGEEHYLREAEETFAFLLAHAVEDGQIRHTYKPGDTRSQGFLEDYAFMARAAFRLYQATAKASYLEKAEGWLADIERQFADPESPLFRYRAEAGLIAPILKSDDGVMPSPNTVVAGLYLDLGHFFYRPEWLQKGKEMVLALQDRFVQLPENYAGWGQLMLRFRYPFHEVAVSGPDAGGLRAEMAREPLPNALLVWASSPSELPLFDGRYDPGQTRIFVCQNHSCRLPVTTAGEALSQIRGNPSLFP